jgi:hypothetical protein
MSSQSLHVWELNDRGSRGWEPVILIGLARSGDRVDQDRGVSLPVALLALVLLPALELEDNDLRASSVLNDRSHDARTINDRSPEANPGLISRCQHLRELNVLSRFSSRKGGDSDHIPGADPELFPAGSDYRVCHGFSSSRLNSCRLKSAQLCS